MCGVSSLEDCLSFGEYLDAPNRLTDYLYFMLSMNVSVRIMWLGNYGKVIELYSHNLENVTTISNYVYFISTSYKYSMNSDSIIVK